MSGTNHDRGSRRIFQLEAEVERLRAENAANERRARAFLAGAEKLQAERDAANALLGRIGHWADGYGSALVPAAGCADSFGDGVRHCKRQIKDMLAHLSGQPAAPAQAACQAELARRGIKK